MIMPNPWAAMDGPPYLLRMDAGIVNAFNASARDEHVIHCADPPEPFSGDPEAPVILLNLNRRYDAKGVSINKVLLLALPGGRQDVALHF